MQNNIRTDLAVELNEEISRKAGRLKGIIVNQHKDKNTGIELFAELEQQETYCSWPI